MKLTPKAALLLLLSILVNAAVAQDAGDDASSGAAAKEEELKAEELTIHGFYSTGLRWRFTGDEWDLDNRTYLGLDVGDPYRHWITAHFLARSATDIHRQRDEDYRKIYDSVEDTYRRTSEVKFHGRTYEFRRRARLYYGYVDIHRLAFVRRLRIGRQLIYDAPETAYFDGGSLLTESL